MKKLGILCCGLVMALGACGGALAQTPQQIDIVLTNYAFAPGTIELKQGVSYDLHFSNGADKSHSFSAPEFFAASQVAPEAGAGLAHGVVELKGGQALDVLITPGRAGSYDFTCTHFMHSTMGMHGTIVVR